MKNLILFIKDESGVEAIEYALIVSLISMAMIISLKNLGQNIINIFNIVSFAMSNNT